jgi:hypothetical protein
MPSSQDSLRFVAVGAAIALVIGAGFVFGAPIAILALAALALLGGIALIWSSVQSLTGETPLSLEEALTLGAPSAEEEQKRAVLRALKDLEYERSVGKITPEDYQELSARYRAEAIRLMQRLDENLKPARARAEKLLKERLAKARIEEQDDETEAPRAEEEKAAPGETIEADEAALEPAAPDEAVSASDAPEDATAEVSRLDGLRDPRPGTVPDGGKS